MKWWNIYLDWQSVWLYYWWITEGAVIKWHSPYLMYDCREYILGHLCCHRVVSQSMLQSSLSVWPAWWDFLPHSNTQMSTCTACYNGNNLNKWSHQPPEYVFLHHSMKMITPPSSPSQTYHPVSVSWISPPPGCGDTTGQERINYSHRAPAISHAFICTSN